MWEHCTRINPGSGIKSPFPILEAKRWVNTNTHPENDFGVCLCYLLYEVHVKPGKYQGVSLLMRVAQLPRDARVPPQLPNGAVVYWAKVQVWAIYSEAIQMLLPSVAAAP